MEKGPYPNVPVYVVCPRGREGCSQTLHRNYLPPISYYLEQGEMDEPMTRVENTTLLTPAPPVDSAPAEAGSSEMVTPSTAGSTPLGSQIDLLHLDVALEPPAGRYWTDQHLQCMGWPVYLSACCALTVYHFLGKYSVKCTPLATSDVCQTLLTPTFRGTPSM